MSNANSLHRSSIGLCMIVAASVPFACSDDDPAHDAQTEDIGADAGGTGGDPAVGTGGGGAGDGGAGGTGAAGGTPAAGSGGAAGDGGPAGSGGSAAIDAGDSGSDGSASDAGPDGSAVDGGGAEAGPSSDAGDAGDAGPGVAPSPIQGVFHDNFGGDHRVTATTWTMGSGGSASLFHVTAVDEVERFLIAHNDPANSFNSDQWSRFEWTRYSGALYYCQVAYDAASEAAALAAGPADATDPTTGGCGGFAWSRLDGPAISGTYVDNFGGVHRVGAAVWDSDGALFHLTQFDDAQHFLITQNDAANAFNPGLWSRYEWTAFGGADYYCQIAYDAATEAAALAAGPADATDPTTGGCGGFAWSELTATPDLHGTWDDDFASEHAVTTTAWTTTSTFGTSVYNITSFDNALDFLVAQNDASNAYSPDLWSRFDWTVFGGETYFCQVAYDAASEVAAEAAGPADATNPATGGCGGFAWSRIVRR